MFRGEEMVRREAFVNKDTFSRKHKRGFKGETVFERLEKFANFPQKAHPSDSLRAQSLLTESAHTIEKGMKIYRPKKSPRLIPRRILMSQCDWRGDIVKHNSRVAPHLRHSIKQALVMRW